MSRLERCVACKLDVSNCVCDEPYTFPDRPATKSSTNTLVNIPQGGRIACPTCGCRMKRREDCLCRCHPVSEITGHEMGCECARCINLIKEAQHKS